MNVHPEHAFKAVVYGMAVQGILINRTEWNLEYLVEIRETFLQQGYPLDLINRQFARGLTVELSDLIFSKSSNKKQKKYIIATLIVTQSPANPSYRKWIQDEIHILHKDPEMKK